LHALPYGIVKDLLLEPFVQLRVLDESGGVVRLEASGDIRQEDVWQRDPLEAMCGADIFKKRVLLGLLETTSIDSSGIGWLLLTERRFQGQGGRFILHSLPVIVSQVIDFLHVHTKLEIAADRQAAERLARD
jgi:anti-anti-sigma regulatory factor